MTHFRGERRRVSLKVQAHRWILVACATASGVLGAWLVGWFLFERAGLQLFALRTERAPLASTLAVVLPVGPDREDPRWSNYKLDTDEEFRQFLARRGSRPTILCLAAPIAEWSSAGPRPDGVVPYQGGNALGLERILNLCLDRPGKYKLLLIVDPGRIGSDPALGIWNNHAATSLEEQARAPADADEADRWRERWRNFGVLLACAPGQASWPIEGRGRGLFDLVLEEAMATSSRLRALRDNVSLQVAHHARTKLEAIQTPLYLGDPQLDFYLPALAAPPSPRAKDREIPWARLDGEFARRDRLAARKPARHARAEWREYLETLRLAELLARAGRVSEADKQLDRAADLARGFFPAPDTFGSLALALRYAPDQSYDAWRARDAALEAAIELPSRSAGAANAAARQPSVLDYMTGASDQGAAWAGVAEGRTIDWTRQFHNWLARTVNLDPKTVDRLFADRGTEFLKIAALARRLERAAAGALDPGPARDLIQQADVALAVALDSLYIGDHARLQAASRLKAAEAPIEKAETWTQAQDLLAEVQAELALLGASAARQAARGDDKPVDAVARIGKLARALADHLDQGPDKAPLTDLANESSAIRAELTGVREKTADLARAPVAANDWRRLDDALADVVAASNDDRKRLRDLAQAFLRPPPAEAAPKPRSSWLKDLFRSVVQRSYERQAREWMESSLDHLDLPNPEHATPTTWGAKSDPDPYRATLAEALKKVDRASIALEDPKTPTTSPKPLKDRYAGLLDWTARRAPATWSTPLELRTDGTRSLGLDPLAVALAAKSATGGGGEGCLAAWIKNQKLAPAVAIVHDHQPVAGPVGVSLAAIGAGLGVFTLRQTGVNAPQGPVELTLQASLFHRGATLDVDPLTFELRPIGRQFVFWFETNTKDPELKRKGKIDGRGQLIVPDQLKGRRDVDAVYVYPHCDHPCLMKLRYQLDDNLAKAETVAVEWGLEPRENAPRRPLSTWTGTLAPGVPVVLGDFRAEFPGESPKAPRDQALLRSARLIARIRRAGDQADGPPIAERVATLHEVNPEFYNTITLDDVRLPDGSPGVKARVQRLAVDPVRVSIGARVAPPAGYAAVTKADGLERELERGKTVEFRFRADAKPEGARSVWRVFLGCGHEMTLDRAAPAGSAKEAGQAPQAGPVLQATPPAAPAKP